MSIQENVFTLVCSNVLIINILKGNLAIINLQFQSYSYFPKLKIYIGSFQKSKKKLGSPCKLSSYYWMNFSKNRKLTVLFFLVIPIDDRVYSIKKKTVSIIRYSKMYFLLLVCAKIVPRKSV